MKSSALKLIEHEAAAHDAGAPFGVIDKVRMEYPAKDGASPVIAIEEASCTMKRGEFVSLLGPSGCGKTTLLRIAGGLIKQSSGSVRIDGREITGPQRNFGFVFQSLNLLPWRTVLKNVLLPTEILGTCDAAMKQRAQELLEMVGLGGFDHARPHELSGGMQQRVALCRYLIHEPSMLLMDEPFGALDELTRMEMHDLLLRVRANTGTTILFVTHSISEAIYLSDQVLVFSKRPSRIAERMRIDIPYPRDVHVRYTPEFTEYERVASAALGVFK